MALAYAELRERGGHGETDAFTASEFPHGRAYDRVLAITRSGTTTDVLELLDRLKGPTPTGAVTADPEAPVIPAADGVVVLDFADEESVVQTRFATTVLARYHGALAPSQWRHSPSPVPRASPWRYISTKRNRPIWSARPSIPASPPSCSTPPSSPTRRT